MKKNQLLIYHNQSGLIEKDCWSLFFLVTLSTMESILVLPTLLEMLLKWVSSIPKPSRSWFTSPCCSRQNKQDVRIGFQYQVGKVTDFDFQSQAIYITTAMDIFFLEFAFSFTI